jgi:short-subunit dehydrogenase
MIEKSATGRKFKRGHAMVMDADVCASIGIDAMIARKSVVVPGIVNRLSAWMCAISPRSWSTWFVAKRVSRSAR